MQGVSQGKNHLKDDVSFFKKNKGQPSKDDTKIAYMLNSLEYYLQAWQNSEQTVENCIKISFIQ